MNSLISSQQLYPREPLALIGIGCRLPAGVATPQELWQLLIEGRDGVIDIPESRWDIKGFYDPDPAMPGKMSVRRGGYLTHPIEAFDPLFFGISPREAASLDPQQRLLLEISWEAFEDAGLDAQKLTGSATGVYIGGFMLDNKITQLSPLNRQFINNNTGTSATLAMLANRISYTFDLRGPSIALDTACSSSLNAFHLACQAIWNEECELAIAGGSSIIFRPEYNIALSKGNFLAPDGRSKSFDERANGYGRGEGAGVVLIKPLKDALQDGDRIYALVHATVSNQDGRTAEGITVPNGEAQRKQVEKALVQANVQPQQLAYVEAHGTGTAVGDPTECRALGEALGKERDDQLMVGSIKANIGHLEAAAGIAAVIKAALIAYHGKIPPQPGQLQLNPNIPFDTLNIKIPQKLETLKPNGLIGVNSFGYGGANAHALLSSASSLSPLEKPSSSSLPDYTTTDECWMLPLSARATKALHARAGIMAKLLDEEQPDLSDLCYSADMRQTHHNHRLVVIGNNRNDLATQLKAYSETTDSGETEGLILGKTIDNAHCPVFVYSGMGPQWWGMGRELMEHIPQFRAEVEACNAYFVKLAGWSILDALGSSEADSQVAETQVAQPASVMLQIGLTVLWRELGVTPAASVGHSVGEIAAAYTAGVFTREQAMAIAYHRSRIQQRASEQGGMLAVGMSEEEVEKELAELPNVVIAAVNSLRSITLAGDLDALNQLAERLQARDIFNRMLRIKVPFHSPYMDPLLPDLRAALEPITPQPSKRPLYSTVTGAQVKTDELWNADYWAANVRQPVRFYDAIKTILAENHRSFLEIGAHPALIAYIREIALDSKINVAVTNSLHRKEPELPILRKMAAQLYVNGANIQFDKLQPRSGQFIPLPRYPFQREHYWRETQAALDDRHARPAPFLPGRRLDTPTPQWSLPLNRQYLPYLPDHRVEGEAVFPAAGYIAVALGVHQTLTKDEATTLTDIHFEQALLIDEHDEPQLHIDYNQATRTMTVHTSNEEQWTRLMNCRLSFGEYAEVTPLELDTWQQSCPEEVDIAQLYQKLTRIGLEYRGLFQGIKRLQRGQDCALAKLSVAYDEHHRLHPALLDSAFQALIALLPSSSVYLPVAIKRLRLLAEPQETVVRAAIKLVETDTGNNTEKQRIQADITLVDGNNQPLVIVEGLVCQKLNSQTANVADITYVTEWHKADIVESTPILGQWVFFMQADPFDYALQAQLSEETLTSVQYSEASANVDALRKLWSEMKEPPARIIYRWGQTDFTDDIGPQDLATITLLRVIQTLTERWADAATTFYLITWGTQAVIEGDQINPATAPLIGLVRVAEREYPNIDWHLLDLESDSNIADVAERLHVTNDEPELALRNDIWWHARWTRATTTETAIKRRKVNPDHPIRLAIEQLGRLNTLHWVEDERLPLSTTEVEISINATALSFKDVVKFLGQFPEEAAKYTYFGTQPGMEVSGVIVGCGSEVDNFKVGDEVIASVRGAFRRYARVDLAAGALLEHKPTTLSHAESAAVPVVYTTAYFALHELAKLRPGQRVLIQSATGGVGFASIGIAQLMGLEIFATAGSEERRDILRSMGIQHVMSSRSLAFVDEVMAATDGQGVHAVINALPGESIEQGLHVLASHGHFIELGKHDIVTGASLSLAPFDRAISFHAIDLDIMLSTQLERLCACYLAVAELIETGKIPPPQVQCFAPDQVVDAFNLMAKAQHTGKLVIQMDLPAQGGLEIVVPTRKAGTIDPDAAYLITGGFGGFGFAVAQWLVERGVQNLVLVSRKGATTPDAQKALDSLIRQGVNAVGLAVDVSDVTAVEQLFTTVSEQLPPLKGIYHAAGLLDDGLLAELTPESFQRVMAPKAFGAWYLHKFSQDLALEDFVLFSSVAVPIGNLGQANYVAANSYLDALATYRHAQGLPARSVQWGVISDVGMAAGNTQLDEHFARQGIHSITSRQALTALETLLDNPQPVCGIFDLDWSRIANNNPRFTLLMETMGDDSPLALLYKELAVLTEDEQEARIVENVVRLVATALHESPEQIDVEVALSDLGLDSIVTTELQINLHDKLGVELSTLELLRHGTVRKLAKHITRRMDIQTSQIENEMESAKPASVTITHYDLSDAPVSYMQLDVLRNQPTALAYSIYFALRIHSDIDLVAIQKAFEELVRRHSSLRTVFVPVEYGYIQRVLDKPKSGFELRDVSGLAWDEITDLAWQAVKIPFDLEQGSLVRLHVFHHDSDDHLLLFNVHHIVADGTSAWICAHELEHLYQAYSQGQKSSLSELQYTFIDYTHWQRNFVESSEGEKQCQFWLERLAGELPVLALPTDHPHPAEWNFRGTCLKFALSPELSEGLNELSRNTNVTLNSILMCGYHLLLAQLTKQYDIIVGYPIAQRTRSEFTNVVGYLANFLCFRPHLDDDMTVNHLLESVQRSILEETDNQVFPYTELAERLTPNAQQIIQTMFAWQKFEHDDKMIELLSGAEHVSWGGLDVSGHSLPMAGVWYDLTMEMMECSSHLFGYFSYSTDLFEHSTIERMLEQYQHIFTKMVNNPQTKIADLLQQSEGRV